MSFATTRADRVSGGFAPKGDDRNLLTQLDPADIYDRMWFRRLILKLMWLSPVILLAALAVHARTYEDPFVPQSTDPSQQSRILSFRPLVIDTSQALLHQADGTQILVLMDRWKQAINQSKVGRLIPVGSDDLCTEGAKGEIFQSSAQLSTYLMSLGQKEADTNPGRALDYYKAALENSELLKYMDLVSVRSAVLNERRAVRLMAQLKLAPKAKVQAANYLAVFLKEQRDLQDLDQLSEEAFNRSRDRAQLDLVSLRGETLEISKTGSYQAAIRHFGTSATPELVSALRMTHYTQSSFESLVKSTIDKLAG